MVIGHALTDKLELLRRLHRMCVVIAQDSGAVLVVQRQAVPDAVLSMLRRRDSPYLDLDPVAALLLQDAAVQIKERVEADVGTVHRMRIISSVDNYRVPSLPHPKLNVGCGLYSRRPPTSADEPLPTPCCR